MTGLLYFTRTQERRRECFLCWNGEEGGLYNRGGENMNGRAFNKG